MHGGDFSILLSMILKEVDKVKSNKVTALQLSKAQIPQEITSPEEALKNDMSKFRA